MPECRSDATLREWILHVHRHREDGSFQPIMMRMSKPKGQWRSKADRLWRLGKQQAACRCLRTVELIVGVGSRPVRGQFGLAIDTSAKLRVRRDFSRELSFVAAPVVQTDSGSRRGIA